MSTLEELLPLMEEELLAGGEVRFRPRGTSMLPFLKEGRDEVVLIAPKGKLKKGDIPFYRRSDGSFVLHRIVGLKKEGYTLCGDNQYRREKGVKPEQIIAVTKAVYRKGRYIPADSLFYKVWGAIHPKYMFLIGLPIRTYHKLRRIMGLCK